MKPPSSRNASCPCGSGHRFKLCCGQPLDRHLKLPGITAEEAPLLPYVLAADEEGFKAGEPPHQRAFKGLMRAMDRLHPNSSYVIAGRWAPPDVALINSIFGKLYRPQDISMDALHMGVVMFRDIFAKMSVPVAFGTVGFKALEMADLSETQRTWLASRPADLAILNDQFVDIFDFGYGIGELNHTRKINGDAKTLLGLAHFQLQAAAATLTAAL